MYSILNVHAHVFIPKQAMISDGQSSGIKDETNHGILRYKPHVPLVEVRSDIRSFGDVIDESYLKQICPSEIITRIPDHTCVTTNLAMREPTVYHPSGNDPTPNTFNLSLVLGGDDPPDSDSSVNMQCSVLENEHHLIAIDPPSADPQDQYEISFVEPHILAS